MEKKIPTYRIRVNPDDETTGVYAVSLVDQPAIEVDWITLSKEIVEFEFSINKDKQMLFGPLLIPGKLILRRDPKGNEYNIVFDEETIQIIADKYNENKMGDIFNFQHSDQKVNAVLLQNWITGSQDKSQDYGFKLPQGTWFAGIKVKDEEFWLSDIKTGKVKGFSVEIMAESELIKMTESLGGPGSGRRGEGGGDKPTGSGLPRSFMPWNITGRGGVVTDPDEISKILQVPVRETTFDKTPNDEIDGVPARIISSLEMEDRIQTAMKTPTQIYNSGNTSDTPDALEFPDRKTAEKIAVMETFGTWSETPQNFTNGEEMVKKGGVWYVSEKGKGKLFNKTATADKNKNINLMEIKTKDGLVFEGDLKVSADILEVKEDGSKAAPADGKYTLEDGSVITVLGGKITEHNPEEKLNDEEEMEVDPNAPVEEPSDANAIIDELRQVIADLASRVDALENVQTVEDQSNVEEQEYRKSHLTKYEELEARVEELSKVAGAPSITIKSDLQLKKEERENEVITKLHTFRKMNK